MFAVNLYVLQFVSHVGTGHLKWRCEDCTRSVANLCANIALPNAPIGWQCRCTASVRNDQGVQPPPSARNDPAAAHEQPTNLLRCLREAFDLRGRGRVLRDHAEDELVQFHADPFPTTTHMMQRESRPIRFEFGAVPSRTRLRLNENQRLLPSIPNPPQDHPEQSVIKEQIAAADFFDLRPRVVGAGPGFPRPDRCENEAIEKQKRTADLANAA